MTEPEMNVKLCGIAESDIKRFFANVHRPAGSECWIWTAGKDDAGYGQFSLGNRNKRAHRISYEIANGEIPRGLLVCHDCPNGDNPSCVNPAHLWLGTNADNLADMARKGRAATGNRHSSKTHPELVRRGDNHPSRLHPECLARGKRTGAHTHPEMRPRGNRHGNAKLTDEAVLEIRRSHSAREGTYAQLGARFAVSNVLIGKIIRREYWTHI